MERQQRSVSGMTSLEITLGVVASVMLVLVVLETKLF